MTKGLPGWFRALFTVVMLAVCIVMVTQLIHHRSAQLQIADLQSKIETIEKRRLKQQAEFDEYTAELPQVEAELAEAAPEAEAAAAQVDALKEQRKELRTQRDALAASLSDLQTQSDAANTVVNADTQSIIKQLEAAINSLNSTLEMLGD